MANRQRQTAARARVSVYGYDTPWHLANLLDSTAALVDRTPTANFVDQEARTAAIHLSRLLVIRMQEADREQAEGETSEPAERRGTTSSPRGGGSGAQR